MKLRVSVCTLLATILVVAGCQKATVEGPSGKKLTLIKPANQTIKQGDTDKVTVRVNRDNFRDAVTVHFDQLPQGIKVQDQDTTIPAGDSLATFTLKAEPNAPPVDKHETSVTAEGPDGMKVTERFQISVKEKGKVEIKTETKTTTTETKKK